MVDAEDSKSFGESRGGSSPSTPTSYYDPAERAREKQRAREQDDEDLRTGKNQWFFLVLGFFKSNN